MELKGLLVLRVLGFLACLLLAAQLGDALEGHGAPSQQLVVPDTEEQEQPRAAHQVHSSSVNSRICVHTAYLALGPGCRPASYRASSCVCCRQLARCHCSY